MAKRKDRKKTPELSKEEQALLDKAKQTTDKGKSLSDDDLMDVLEAILD